MFSLITSIIDLCLLSIILYLTIKSHSKVKELEKRVLDLETRPELEEIFHEERPCNPRAEIDNPLAFNIAKYIINRCISRNSPISNLQLNRIMFLFYVECYKRGIKSVQDKLTFEAWDYGPVCRPIYMEYCVYGATKLTIRPREDKNNSLDQDIVDALEKVITYAEVSPWQLQRACTEHKAYKSCYKEGEKAVIPNTYFKEK